MNQLLPINNLLIVDDDPFIPTLLEMAIHSQHPEVEITCLTDGLKAAEYLQSAMPDLVLCDMLMPNLDGSSLLLLLSKQEKTKNLPMVFFTALGSRDLAQFKLDTFPNVLGVLRKPLDPNCLLGDLLRLYEQYQQRLNAQASPAEQVETHSG